MIRITDINSPLIRHYKTLRYTPAEHIRESIFVAESEKIVLKLLTSKLEIVSIFCSESFIIENIDLIKSKNIPENSIYTADMKLMNEIVGFKVHTGVMAIGKQPDEPLIDNLALPAVLLNKIINAENVGSIVRNCAAFGINTIICDKQTASPYLRRCVRVSMGNVFNCAVYHCDSLESVIMPIKAMGGCIIAAENCAESINLKEYRFPQKSAFIFGSEGDGIDSELLGLSDSIVRIPICQDVPSINVAAASAVFLNAYYQSTKQ